MKEKKIKSLKIVFEDGNDYSVACEVGLDKDEVAKYIERAFRPEPAEPLIKDKKIRKAVKAWAEANEIGSQDTIRFDAIEHRLIWVSTAIEFNEYEALSDLEKEEYTIAELCGEEE